ncbi:MAG: hypothetical protein A3E87_04375 [Gammaproteobacteria bacterium RIFCSPHIGHO2_12_FULL_35_23]|nr:MAG: hypothetical protein A3E87_04375 [Gammaproteobacteria bacterium RIFCSPHIGHO2_12_FULL_35_23]
MTEKITPIDLEFGAKLVSNDKAMAKELITMLLAALPEHKKEIIAAYESNNLEALAKATHKLHGATCYTGTPRLKISVAELELAAKHHETDRLKTLYENLIQEIELVLNYPFQ